MDVKKLFGEEIRRLRIDKLGVSQEIFALNNDIDRTFLSKMERGVRQPSLETLLKIAVGLKVKPSTLIANTVDQAYELETQNKKA